MLQSGRHKDNTINTNQHIVLIKERSPPAVRSFTVFLPCFRDRHVFLSDYFAQHDQTCVKRRTARAMARETTEDASSTERHGRKAVTN